MLDEARQQAVLRAEARIKGKPGEVGVSEPTPAEPAQAAVPEAPEKPEVVAEVAPAEVAAPQEEEDTDDSAPSTDDPSAPHPKNKGVGKRINELTREKHEERRAREQAEAENAYLKQQLQAQQPKPAEPVQHVPQGEPTLEQFGWDQNKYLDARASWLVDQKMAQRELEQRRQSEQVAEQTRQQKFAERLKAFEETNPGEWDAVVKAPMNVTEPMLAYIKVSDIGPQVGHYLKDHLDEAHAISRMEPILAVRALGLIEGKLTTKPTPQAAPQNITRAPPPPATVTSGSASTKPVAQWTLDDHRRHVLEQRKAKFPS